MVRCGLAGGAGTERGNDTGTRANIMSAILTQELAKTLIRKKVDKQAS